MHRRLAFLSLALALSLALFTSISPLAIAATRGIGVAPGMMELELRDDQDGISFEVNVSNTTDSRLDFRLSTIDFGALDESGGVAFLGKSGQETYAYSLSKWMKLDRYEISLSPGETETVVGTVTNQDNLSPGGHYGAVLVTSRGDERLSSDSVAMLPGASALVLLKKIGGEKYDLGIESIKANKSFFKIPQAIDIRFQNKGNIHAVPRGTVELSDPLGRVMARGIINEASSYVLPETYRQVNVPLNFNRQPWLPGRYTLEVAWRYEGTNQVKTEVIQQWYLGKLGISLLVIVSSAIVLFMFIVYKKRPVTRN